MTPILEYAAVASLYEVGRFDEAYEAIETILTIDPDGGSFWELKGLILHARGESDAARNALETASVLIPLTPVARCALADCYAHAGPLRLAYDMYRSLLAEPKTPPALLLPIAAGLDHVGASALALLVCRKAVRRDPDSARAWHDLACYLSRCEGPPHLVRAAARKAVALAPDETRYQIALVAFLYETGLVAEAYGTVARLTTRQIAEVGCRGCLTRLLSVYEAAGDGNRASCCRERLLRLVSETPEEGEK